MATPASTGLCAAVAEGAAAAVCTAPGFAAAADAGLFAEGLAAAGLLAVAGPACTGAAEIIEESCAVAICEPLNDIAPASTHTLTPTRTPKPTPVKTFIVRPPKG